MSVFGLNKEAWDRWSDYKRKMRKPYKTEFAIERAQKKLASFGEWQMQTVEHCMEREWMGLFPLSKSQLADLEKRKANDSKERKAMMALMMRAMDVGFRNPLPGEDSVGYGTLVARAEHQAWQKKPVVPVSIRELLGAKT